MSARVGAFFIGSLFVRTQKWRLVRTGRTMAARQTPEKCTNIFSPLLTRIDVFFFGEFKIQDNNAIKTNSHDIFNFKF